MSAAELVARWVRPEIRGLSAYHVPDPGRMIKLDAMENPYAWPETMVEEWLGLLRQVPLNRYPDPSARRLVEPLRESMAIPEGAGVLLGNGSDEIIQMLAMAVGGHGRVLLSPEPGFAMYPLIARCTGMDYVGLQLESDFGLSRSVLLDAVARHEPALIFIAYPNNPTGNLFDEATLVELLDTARCPVVIDEAYAPFAEASFMDRLGRYDNLLVMRTVSKMGLAGLRLGLLAGDPAWITELDKIRLPYNINVLTQASAEFALRHRSVLNEQTAQIRADRETLFEALQRRPALTVYPSKANFLLLRMDPGTAPSVFEGLKARGVLVKKLHGSHPALADCLRVTVGRPEENQAFLNALDAVIA